VIKYLFRKNANILKKWILFQSYNNSQNSEEMHITGQVSSTSDTHDTMVMQAYHVVESEESMLDPAVKPKAVHQCPVCNKIFVSFKGLSLFFCYF